MSAGLHRIAVVGGGLAGARSCEQLRRQGYEGELTLVAAEPDRPYDRPPLSKEVLRGERDVTTLPVDLGGIGVQVSLCTAATRLDLEHGVLHTYTVDTIGDMPAGSVGQLRFDGLVIATGATPVTLPGAGEQLVVRTLADAHRLRDRLVPGARVVVIGASWIGAEVASSARARGCSVTCLEADAAPALRTLGPEVGRRLKSWWDGIDLRLGTRVDRIDDGAALLADGTSIACDVVVVGVGVQPQTRWLAGSGINLDRGVVVDEHLQAAPRVVAVGDVAAWWSRRYNTRLRVEHWDDAAVGPAVAAAALLGADSPDPVALPVHDPVPYFWSDQFGHKIQYAGHHDPTTAPVLREPLDGKGWSAAWLDDDRRLSAVLAVDRPRELVQARKALAAGCTPDRTRLADPAVALSEL